MSNLLEVKNLKTQFFTDDGIAKAVDGVSFTIAPGETLGLVGESGSGKSVTALSVMGLHTGTVTGGEVLFEGKDLLKLSKRELQKVRGGDVSMIFQAVFVGYSVGSAPVISYHFGAQHVDELQSLLRKSIVIVGCFAAAMCCAGIALSRPLSSLYVSYDKELLEMTIHAFCVFSVSFLFCFS